MQSEKIEEKLSQQIVTVKEKKSKFYGGLVRVIKSVYRLFTKKYDCNIVERETSCVYVCRHLNMHGPLTTLKSLKFDVHPLVLNVFFDKKSSEKHFRTHTFSKNGNYNDDFSLKIKLFSFITPKIINGLQSVPVYRKSNPIKTLKSSIKYLKKGESLIVYPDIDYKAGYGEISPIYDGFLILGEIYKRQTGKDLKFVPLYIDEKNRSIVEMGDVVISDYKKEFSLKKDEIVEKINGV